MITGLTECSYFLVSYSAWLLVGTISAALIILCGKQEEAWHEQRKRKPFTRRDILTSAMWCFGGPLVTLALFFMAALYCLGVIGDWIEENKELDKPLINRSGEPEG